MKSFLRSLLATVIGIFLSFLLIFLFFFVSAMSMISKQEKEVVIKPNTILYLKLDRPIVDRQPLETFNFDKFSRENRIGLNQILSSIKNAKYDNNIEGILLESAFVGGGIATIEEIREALIDFQESGKFIVAYSNVYTQSGYYLSSVADKIFYNPAGYFSMNGLQIQTTHFKNTLEKLDIEPIIVKIGNYKGMPEMFEFDKMSKYNREQYERLIGNIWTNLSENISKSRNINIDTLNYIINNLQLKDPEQVLKSKLVDSVIYKGDVINYLKNLTGTDDKDDLNSVKLSNYAKVPSVKKHRVSNKEKVAVIYASGTIVDNEGGDENVGGEKYAREIRKARRDSTVKAIVLRVNSPGGSAMASDAILEEIKLTKGVKPIVVSMGDVAASGGYYISCGADKILANENTITGSIGVYSIFFNAKDFFNKFGVNFDVAKTHEHSDMLSGNRPITREERAYLMHSTEYIYSQFLNRVSEGRDMDINDVHNIAQGRVWSGSDAIEVGLVDEFGGLKEAIKVARDLADLDESAKIVELPKLTDPIEQFLKELTGGAKIYKVLEPLGMSKHTFLELKDMYENQGTVARLPYAISFEW